MVVSSGVLHCFCYVIMVSVEGRAELACRNVDYGQLGNNSTRENQQVPAQYPIGVSAGGALTGATAGWCGVGDRGSRLTLVRVGSKEACGQSGKYEKQQIRKAACLFVDCK